MLHRPEHRRPVLRLAENPLRRRWFDVDSKIGQFRTRAELLESIIFPSMSVAPQYQTHTITMRDGRVDAGLIVRETADQLLLRRPDLAEASLLRINVDEILPSAKSLMPDGLERSLTRKQLADLLEFLRHQK